MKRIYLDNAATSWPKPEAVLAAMEDYQRRLGAPAGRGVYREAIETERIIAEARRRLGELLGVAQANRIIFCGGCTDALNIALHGLLRAGDHVITTVTEHNSVLRPLRFLEETRGISVTRVACGARGIIAPDDVRRAIQSQTRMIVLNHVSNVTGAIQPAVEIGRIAAEHNLLYLLDAAQSAGHLNITASELGAQLIAVPGHKGLLGPLGIGVLYVGPGVEAELASFRQGGTGTKSEDDHQPESLPDRYESGTHNVPGIVGLAAGAQYVQKTGLAAIRKHLRGLTELLLSGLREIKGVTIFGPGDAEQQLGVVSIAVKGFDPHEAAAALDGAYHVQARPGIQCAPQMHAALGTLKTGGTLRLSVGLLNKEAEVEAAVQALAELARSASG
jgi:cysteine desulfurase family protein